MHANRLPGLVGLLTGLVLAAACTPALAADTPARPNIIFILADDLGWTDLGCQGSKYYETPNIDRLARQGVRFTSGYTCGPNCAPTSNGACELSKPRRRVAADRRTLSGRRLRIEPATLTLAKS